MPERALTESACGIYVGRTCAWILCQAEVSEDQDTLSIVYSNRAAALLGQADVLAAQLRDRADKDSIDFTHGQQKVVLFRQAAASDAERSTQVADKWVKGYLRLGQCQLELHNYADSAAAYWRAGELVKDGDFKRKYHKKFKHAVQVCFWLVYLFKQQPASLPASHLLRATIHPSL